VYLLDTDTLIYSLKGETAVMKNLRDHYHDPLKMSVITLMELYYGAHKSQKISSNLAKIKTLELSFEIIPISEESAEIFGMTKAQLEKEGSSLDDVDLMIASCALTKNLVLVTNNVRHFRRIEGLKLTNWTKYPPHKP